MARLGKALYMSISTVQSLGFVQLYDPMDCSMIGFPVNHQLPELAQTHVHLSVMPSKHLSSVVPFSSCLQSFPELGSFRVSQFASGGQGTGASASVLPMNIQDWYPLELIGLTPCTLRDSQKASSTPPFQGINSSALIFLYDPNITSIHDHWKSHSFSRQLLAKWCLCFLICCLGWSNLFF